MNQAMSGEAVLRSDDLIAFEQEDVLQTLLNCRVVFDDEHPAPHVELSSDASSTTGREREKVLPAPGALWTEISPP